jgi:hypothetical protein
MSEAFAGKPGWFFVERDGGKEVYVSVPPIEGFGRLVNHQIDANGGVSPSVKITGTNKDGTPNEYHEFLILNNWPVGVKKESGIYLV